MSNETFQIIVTVATVLALLAMLAQAIILFALLRSAQKMKTAAAPFLTRAKSVFSIERAAVRRVEIVVDKTLPCLEAFATLPAKVDMLTTRIRSLGGGSGQVTTRIGELRRSVAQTEFSTHRLIDEIRPRVGDLTEETSALLRSAQAQGVRVGQVFREIATHLTHLLQFVPHR